jgi:hypothetical protein
MKVREFHIRQFAIGCMADHYGDGNREWCMAVLIKNDYLLMMDYNTTLQ